MVRLGLLVFALVIGASMATLAQDSSQVEVENQLEQAFEELDDESGEVGEQLTQFLEDLTSNPVNINAAGATELLQIPGMNVAIANAIVQYRRGQPFEAITDLMNVPGIGKETFNRLKPYITVGGFGDRLKGQYLQKSYWTKGGKLEVLTRYQQNLEEQEGYVRADSSGGYVGNSMKYYQRFRWQSTHLSLNLTQEKDAGESLTRPTDFDYTSWHIALQNNGKLKALVVGDYSLSVGQGLVLWTGGAFGKGREVIETVSKNERGVRPYSSAQETDFFRGIAATYGNQLELTAFYSDRPRTASEISPDTTRFPSSSGFHRTESEIERKNNMQQQTVGGRVSYNSKIGLLGATAYQVEFSNYVLSGTDLYDFAGTSNSVFGIDYRGLIGRTLVFGEVARSENGGVGGIIGAQSSVDSRTEISLSFREYQNDFQSFLGDGFGEKSSAPQNETGFYTGLKHQLSSVFQVSGYFDQYRFGASSTEVAKATFGHDVLALIDAKLNRYLEVYLLLRSESKDDEYVELDDDGREKKWVDANQRNSARLHLQYQVNPSIRIRSRAEIVRYKPVGEGWENGFLAYQDIRFQITNKLKFDTRFTLFDTDTFNTRVYQFESDLRYVMSNVALSDQGQRWYVVLDYKPTEYLQIWAKYSITVIEDAQTLSSGLAEIQGNTKSFVGIQTRVYIR